MRIYAGFLIAFITKQCGYLYRRKQRPLHHPAGGIVMQLPAIDVSIRHSGRPARYPPRKRSDRLIGRGRAILPRRSFGLLDMDL
ncbi:MAG: hypothetical protein ACK4NZ_13665 [Tsuneonella sp.]